VGFFWFIPAIRKKSNSRRRVGSASGCGTSKPSHACAAAAAAAALSFSITWKRPWWKARGHASRPRARSYQGRQARPSKRARPELPRGIIVSAPRHRTARRSARRGRQNGQRAVACSRGEQSTVRFLSAGLTQTTNCSGQRHQEKGQGGHPVL